ncbi:hypothetical protein DSY2370 [Desulfitobacterium hafniense Y51]|uniref:Uncharacterized protein n=1 Tax=Desulfitobacterium hafniense (strain Y51) TaxID=138119 RepID=Q24UY3_DESHY|nr:hypothetical protein DSY2370 [Desulfitobacterium hafniense Y51]
MGMTVESAIPAWTESSAQDLAVLAPGEVGEAISTNAVQEQYKAIVVSQIKALTVGMEGIKELQVNVDLAEGSSGLTNIPRIDRIMIHLDAEERGVQPIEDIVIDLNEPKPTQEQVLSATALEIRDKVALFMQMPREQVIITEG